MIENRIIIPGNPTAAHRPRFSRKLGRAYDSQKDVRDCMTWHVASQWSDDPLEGAVTLDVVFYMQLPKSMSKKRRTALNGQPCLKAWDLDNGLKILQDACNGVIFKDDSQVYNITCKKIWDEDGRTEILIYSDSSSSEL